MIGYIIFNFDKQLFNDIILLIIVFTENRIMLIKYTSRQSSQVLAKLSNLTSRISKRRKLKTPLPDRLSTDAQF